MNLLPLLTMFVVFMNSCGMNIKKRGTMIDTTKYGRKRKRSSLEDKSPERQIPEQEKELITSSESEDSTDSTSIQSEHSETVESEHSQSMGSEHPPRPDQESHRDKKVDEKSVLQLKLQASRPSFCSGVGKRIKELKENDPNQLKKELNAEVLNLIFKKHNQYALQALIDILNDKDHHTDTRDHLIQLLDNSPFATGELRGDYESTIPGGVLGLGGGAALTVGIVALSGGAAVAAMTFGGIILAPLPFLAMTGYGRYRFKSKHKRLQAICRDLGIAGKNDLGESNKDVPPPTPQDDIEPHDLPHTPPNDIGSFQEGIQYYINQFRRAFPH